jgi:hypothetical protein
MRAAAVLLLLVLWGCAQPPKQEVEMAADRLEKARMAGADEFAADLLNEAESALHEAEAALSERRTYREAVRAAARACIRADEACEKTIEEKERVHRSTVRLLKECRALIEEARSLGAEIIRSEELDSYSSRLEPIQKPLEEGRVAEALEGASQLKNDLLDFHERLKGDINR